MHLREDRGRPIDGLDLRGRIDPEGLDLAHGPQDLAVAPTWCYHRCNAQA
jgi:hypothetical protein